MKRVFFVYLVLCCSLTLMAQKREYRDGLYWEYSNGVLTISGHGPIKTWARYVVSVDIKKLIIKEGITSINKEIFSGCNSIQSVELPISLTSIGEFAFNGCSSLRSLEIPNSVTSIEQFAFFQCSSLQNVVFPSSLLSIGRAAFKNCSNLQSVVFPNSQISIEDQTFYNCDRLLDVDIPSSITHIGQIAFGKNTNVIIHNPLSSYRIDFYDGTVSIPVKDKKGNLFYLVKRANSTRGGLKNSEGKWIIPFNHYDDVQLFEDVLKVIKYKFVKRKEGLCSFDGREIIPCEMEALESAGTGYMKYNINGFWGVMDYAGKILIGTERGYTSIGDFVTFTKRFPYTMAGYKGECNINGHPVSKIKVETPQQSVAKQETTTPQKEKKKEKEVIIIEQQQQRWYSCGSCGGLKRCTTCNGNQYTWSGNSRFRCYNCNGTGICPSCNGQGGWYGS